MPSLPSARGADDAAPHDVGITAAQVQLMQRGVEILSSRPPLGDEAATRSGSVLACGSRMQTIVLGEEERGRETRRWWTARHMLVVTASSLVLCLLVGSLLLMDVSDQALAPGIEGFLSGGAAREDALLSGSVQKKTAAAKRLASLAQRSMWPSDHAPPIPGNARAAKVEAAAKKAPLASQLAQKPAMKVVEATPLTSLAKASAVATAKIVVPKPAVTVVKAPAKSASVKATKPAANPPVHVAAAKPARIAAPKAFPMPQQPAQAQYAQPQEAPALRQPQPPPQQQEYQYPYGYSPQLQQQPPQASAQM